MSGTLEKTIISEGSGASPKPGDNITMEYTGWVYDSSKPQNRGKKFDSSVGRGDFKCRIGVGQLIQGWDQGVPTMKLGERAVLTIPPHLGYGAAGIPGTIPQNATLIFEVQLKGIGK